MVNTASASREILESFASTVRSSRRARRWTQRRLADAVGISQAHLARVERARVLALEILEALDGRADIRFIGVSGAPPAQHDRAHARCVAYVARSFARIGFAV